MKIPFDIKYKPQIESGEYKVVSSDDRNARIVCWDRKGDKPIIALLETNRGVEEYALYDEQGHSLTGTMSPIPMLFVITPEPELTDLERAIKRGMLCAGLGGVSTTIIKETAKEVKDIICKGCPVGLDAYWRGRADARKEYEKPITYHFPTYWPPCYHGGVCTNPMRDCINCPRTGSDVGISTTSGTCKKD